MMPAATRERTRLLVSTNDSTAGGLNGVDGGYALLRCGAGARDDDTVLGALAFGCEAEAPDDCCGASLVLGTVTKVLVRYS